ncbi:hypothetical protein TSUD_356790 [Trifolium subterraneum]|uniref:Uncharacterized protein n=1 Tax=Trifolium subterraneum TaxID=3900 RepID=A0A2Z6N1U8_TRISU|nr:hypothetical protein TSUD_356790 [Trifolium subterraneum]
MGEPYYKPNPCTVVTLLNCKKLESHWYHTVLKNWTELGARLNSSNEDDTIQYLFLAMQGIEYWSHYTSTQVSFTLELPPNMFGFSYYLALSQGYVGKGISFGCECYLDNISDSVPTSDRTGNCDPVANKVADCNPLWITMCLINEGQNRVEGTESDEQEGTIVPTKKLKQHVFGTPSKLEAGEIEDLRCLLEELLNIGFGGDLMQL